MNVLRFLAGFAFSLTLIAIAVWVIGPHARAFWLGLVAGLAVGMLGLLALILFLFNGRID